MGSAGRSIATGAGGATGTTTAGKGDIFADGDTGAGRVSGPTIAGIGNFLAGGSGFTVGTGIGATTGAFGTAIGVFGLTTGKAFWCGGSGFNVGTGTAFGTTS